MWKKKAQVGVRAAGYESRSSPLLPAGGAHREGGGTERGLLVSRWESPCDECGHQERGVGGFPIGVRMATGPAAVQGPLPAQLNAQNPDLLSTHCCAHCLSF